METVHRLFRSPVQLPNIPRLALIGALQTCLMDGVAMAIASKVAHWNVKGPGFGPIHVLFDSVANTVGSSNDRIAERLVALGGLTQATVQAVAARSSLPAMPADVTRDLALVRLIVDRLDGYLKSLAMANGVAEGAPEPGTVNLLGDVIEVVGKQAWMVLSHLEAGGE